MTIRVIDVEIRYNDGIMPRMSPEDRSERLVRFLMGLRDPEVAATLRECGFTEEDRREGYRLLEAQTADALLAEPIARDRSRELIARLDAWENQWFPIANASLRHRFPIAHEWLFRNLGQTSGAELVIYVRLFLDRLEALPSENIEGAKEAAEFLVKRRLTPEVVAEARELVNASMSSSAGFHDPPISPEELARRDEALWAYYLEWSAIARASIKDARLLRKLGFGKRGRPKLGAAPEPVE